MRARAEKPLSAENELGALGNLLQCLEKVLDSLPTSLEHDLQLLRDAHLTQSQRLAVTIRAGQKRILTVHVGSLRRRVAVLSGERKE